MFGRDSKAGKRLGTLYNGKKKKREKVFGMEAFGMGKWREANEKQSSL